MSTPQILVTGAAGGQQGSTGNHVARMLLERGISVRALVHHDDERSDNIRKLGAEIVEGDLLDFPFVRDAMKGIRRAYFAYPVQDGLLDATAVFAAAARQAKVELVANLSQMIARDGTQPTPHQWRHWLSEQMFDWADVGVVHLDAVVFFENLRAMSQGTLARTGMVLLPWGPDSTIFPMIAGEDVARVAVGVLLGPIQPKNTFLPLIGEVLTIRDMMTAFSDVLGRPIPYQEISDEQWGQNVSSRINSTAVVHLTHLWRHLRTRNAETQASYQVSPAVEKFSGQPPKSLRQFLTEQADQFTVGSPATSVNA
jgi:uncharacterized protein YbjT (DUF2867 family)